MENPGAHFLKVFLAPSELVMRPHQGVLQSEVRYFAKPTKRKRSRDYPVTENSKRRTHLEIRVYTWWLPKIRIADETELRGSIPCRNGQIPEQRRKEVRGEHDDADIATCKSVLFYYYYFEKQVDHRYRLIMVT